MSQDVIILNRIMYWEQSELMHNVLAFSAGIRLNPAETE